MTQDFGYRDVKALIVERIKSKVWVIGDVLPGEVQLAEELGVARATVNRAMRELSEEGLVERKRKAGTRVADPGTRAAKVKFPNIRREIEQSGARYRYALISREVGAGSDWVRARMGVSEATRLVHLRAVHFADARPFQVEERWINGDLIQSALSADFETKPPGEWLITEVPFSDAELSFFANAAQGGVARFLELDEGEPVFGAERKTWLHGQPVTFGRFHFARDYRLTAVI